MTKKRLAALVGAVAALTVGIAAFAFWTAGGSGSGTGTTASGGTVITVTPSGLGGLTPGGSKTFDVGFSNPNTFQVNATHVLIDDSYGDNGTTTLTGTGTGGNGITTSDANCLSSWFSTDKPDYTLSSAVLVPAKSGANGTNSSTGVGTVSMTDETATNQDACKGATVTLHLKSS